MKNGYPRFFSRILLFFFFVICFGIQAHAQCGLDIYIANDQSGSVDTRENLQSREFIERLALSLPLGNANDRSRIAISSWSYTNQFEQYNFPVAGAGYTTIMSDIVAYSNSPKPFSGNTDPHMALLRAWQNIGLTSVPGRNVPRLIILMTDAYPDQVNPGIITLANQIKAAGVRILVMGIDGASQNPPQNILQQVASPGLNFSALSYAALYNNAATTIQNMFASFCSLPAPPFDLVVSLNSFDCATGSVNYTVSNTGGQAFGPAILHVSFYSRDPRNNNSSLLANHSQTNITILPSSSYSYNYTNSSLANINTLYAVVNLDITGNNATPPLPSDLTSRLLVSGEGNALNNFSDPFAASGCNRAVVEVSNTGSMGCSNTANYHVQVCNAGSADVNIDSIKPLVPAGFILQNVQQLVNPQSGGFNNVASRIWGTYFGGTSSNILEDVAVDAGGNIYIAGSTASNTGIATAGTYDNTFNGAIDGFVVKFSPSGQFLWGTYVGGIASEAIREIKIDDMGGLYVSGSTTSNSGIATSGSFQVNLAGAASDAFLIKFNTNDGTRVWGTYYGHAGGIEQNTKLAIANNHVYIAIATQTGDATLTTDGTGHIGGYDILLAKFDALGNRIWATLWGGSSDEDVNWGKLASDGSSVFLGGITYSTTGIAYGNYWDNVGSASGSAMVASFSAANGTIIWATYADVDNNNNVRGLAIEPSGSIVVGVSGSRPRIYRFSSAGGAPTESVNAFNPNEIFVDNSGNIYESGTGTGGSIYVTPQAYQPNAAGGTDLYFAVYYSSLGLKYWSYYGDAGSQPVNGGMVVDASGNIILACKTNLANSTVLATAGAHLTTSGAGGNAGFIAKFSPTVLKGSLPAGTCTLLDYIYNASNATNGSHDASFQVEASKVLPVDGNPIILPDNNFTVPGYTGTFNGFNGAVNSTDDVVKSAAPCTTPRSPVTITITPGPSGNCGQTFSTARIDIDNPNPGITFSNAKLAFNLSGAGSVFSGEPYNISTGLVLAAPDITNPNYPVPGVAEQLNGYNGLQYLTIYSIPPGSSSFIIDVATGVGITDITVQIQNLPVLYNPGGVTSTVNTSWSVMSVSPPIISLNCPGPIDAGSDINFSGTVVGATTVQWTSSSTGNLPNAGDEIIPQVNYTPTAADLAAGYVDISLTAINANGCDAVAECRILINNVVRDFGDAPSSFDLGELALPVAAGSTLYSNLYLGSINPDTEPASQPSANCNYDGSEEDGLIGYLYPPVAGQTNWGIYIRATNNSGKEAYLAAFLDWNGDGDFLDQNEQSAIKVIPASSGVNYYVSTFIVPSFSISDTYLRLRLSTDSVAVRFSYGGSSEGEVEDHLLPLVFPLNVRLTVFSARRSGEQAVLNWETASEVNNNFFDIERSADGTANWQKIGRMAGKGFSTQLQSYSFTDHQPLRTRNFYRLKQVDTDGRFTYSDVRQVNFETGAVVKISPNPLSDQLYILSDRNNIRYDVRITNASGQQVLKVDNVAGGSAINMKAMPNGIYIIQLSSDAEKPEYFKVMKQ